MRRVLLVATVLFCLLVGSANAWKPGEKAARTRCAHGHVRSCIHRAALHNGQSYGAMLAVARCESNYNPYAHNSSGATGLFQIMFPSTWGTTPYARHSPWSAKWNSLAAAWMWRHGRRGEWEC